MTSSRRLAVLSSVALAAAILPAIVSSGTAASAAASVMHASRSQQLGCTTRAYPKSKAVDERRFTATVTGIVQARLSGRGDWDLAVFDAKTRKVVAGSTGYTSTELAEGFVIKGQHLLVQACRFRGKAATTRLRLEYFRTVTSAPTAKAQLVTVSTPSREAKQRLQALDLDLTENGTAGTVTVLLHGSADAAALRRAKLRYRVKVADAVRREQRDRAADETYARTTARSGLPSNRTSYRHLWNYEFEMKRLSIRYPDLVRPLTLPNRSIEGRPVEGIEITRHARTVHDGKPVFLNVGVHHAREWPAAEHVMEFAYDLLRRYRAGGTWARRIAATRTILVPVVNPDGFSISRQAPSTDDDFSAFDYANKRKNCRATDAPAAYRGGTCGANAGGAYRGTDPNRNYGGFWGGPGADVSWDGETFRGAKPFSEPEVRNIRALVSRRQVVTLITNHTYSDLINRVPGTYDARSPLEDKLYERLGARLASHNGYTNQRGYDLYDSTGDTEDWSYFSTGGFGFTFEIGDVSFHPAFDIGVVAEYLGRSPARGAGRGGNRAAYFAMLAATADSHLHSTLTGTAPKGAIVRVHKQFTTPTSPVIRADGTVGRPLHYTDVLDSTYRSTGGRFRFAVNPSTRPYVAGRLGRKAVAPAQADGTFANPAGVPAQNQDDPLSGASERIPFTVQGPPKADNGTALVSIRWASATSDWDLYVIDSAGKIVASSATGGTTSETARLIDPKAGKYTAVVVNYEAGVASDWGSGTIDYASPLPTTRGTTERWTVTCQSKSGRVLGRQRVFVARGKARNLGAVCR